MPKKIITNRGVICQAFSGFPLRSSCCREHGKTANTLLTNWRKNHIIAVACGRGGIGIRARLRGVFLTEYGFKSHRPHQAIPCEAIMFRRGFSISPISEHRTDPSVSPYSLAGYKLQARRRAAQKLHGVFQLRAKSGNRLFSRDCSFSWQRVP